MISRLVLLVWLVPLPASTFAVLLTTLTIQGPGVSLLATVMLQVLTILDHIVCITYLNVFSFWANWLWPPVGHWACRSGIFHLVSLLLECHHSITPMQWPVASSTEQLPLAFSSFCYHIICFLYLKKKNILICIA